MTIYFSADTHFCHARVIDYCRRPFDSIEAMNETLIERWNAVVSQSDVVYHLGDVGLGWRVEEADRLLRRLHGHIHLLVGNHDGPITLRWSGWASVQDYISFKLNKRRFVLGHYPFRSWRGSGRGSINLHGHEHGRLPPLAHQCDVGVDVWGFAPVSIEAILSHLPEAETGGR